jgi:hypothetical protein
MLFRTVAPTTIARRLWPAVPCTYATSTKVVPKKKKQESSAPAIAASGLEFVSQILERAEVPADTRSSKELAADAYRAKMYSRLMMREHRARLGYVQRVIVSRNRALEALPEPLRSEAAKPLAAPFGPQHWTWTTTPASEEWVKQQKEFMMM